MNGLLCVIGGATSVLGVLGTSPRGMVLAMGGNSRERDLSSHAGTGAGVGGPGELDPWKTRGAKTV